MNNNVGYIHSSESAILFSKQNQNKTETKRKKRNKNLWLDLISSKQLHIIIKLMEEVNY